jgi:hypothetical protein
MPASTQLGIATLSEPVAVHPHRPLPNSLSYFFGAPIRKVSLARSTPSGKLRTVHARRRDSKIFTH